MQQLNENKIIQRKPSHALLMATLAMLPISFVLFMVFVYFSYGTSPVAAQILQLIILTLIPLGWFQFFRFALQKVDPEVKRQMQELNAYITPFVMGYQGETQVTQTLDKLEGNFALINDITIPTKYGGETQIDHVLICPNGTVLCIETKNISGRFYPIGNKWNWYPYQGYVKQTTNQYGIYSPQLQSINHAKHLKYNLKRAGMLTLKVVPIVVMVNPRSTFKGNHDLCPVLYLNQLTRFAKKQDHTSVVTEHKEINRIMSRIIDFSEFSKSYQNHG